MNKRLEEFLALRQASVGAGPDLSRHDPDRLEHQHAKPSEQAVGSDGGQDRVPADSRSLHPGFDTRGGGINEQDLATYFAELLAAYPIPTPLKNRQGLAHYLARGIMYRFANPEQLAWASETALRRRTPDNALQIAQCPAGHLTDEIIENHEVIGWACKACQRVYDATECRMVPRRAVPRTGAEPERSGDGIAG